jgi:zinc transporter 1
MDQVQEAIEKIPHVMSVHDLHVWQLSDTKIVASAHVLVHSDGDLMAVQAAVQRVMHDFGVHSTTVQPELLKPGQRTSLLIRNRNACLSSCPEECNTKRCCPQEEGHTENV